MSEPSPQELRDFHKKWFSNPETYADAFKSWLIQFVQNNPNFNVSSLSLPSGYDANLSGLRLRDLGSSTETDIFWERNPDGSVIAKIAGQTFGSSPNRQSVLQISTNQPDSGGSALSQVDIMATKNGTPVVKTLLDSAGESDWLLDFGGGTFLSSIASSPPGSPTDGDVWIYDGGGYYWMFVYDSSETTNKWKFVGGPPLSAYSSGDQGTSGTTTFTAPVLTLPRSGDYFVSFSHACQAGPNVNTQTRWDNFLYKNDTTEVGERSVYSFVADVTGFAVFFNGTVKDIPLSFAANDYLKVRGAATNWDFTSFWRTISVVPYRVI